MSVRQVQILDQDSQEVLLTLDAAVSYTISGDVDATDHPVEQGGNVTDHLRPKPRTIDVEGWVSNTPVAPAAGSEYPTDEPGPAEAAYAMLENRRQGGFLHTLVTKLDTFQNMALIRVSEPRSAGVGDALQMQVTFKEIRIVQNQTITFQTAQPQQQPNQKVGTKVPTPVTPSASDSSLVKGFLNNQGITTAGSGR